MIEEQECMLVPTKEPWKKERLGAGMGMTDCVCEVEVTTGVWQ